MKLTDRRIMNRLDEIEASREALGQAVMLVYADGHTEKRRETLTIRELEVEAYIDWSRFVDGWIDTPPELTKVVYLESGEEWDFESEARKPPMTEEEAEEIAREIHEAVTKGEYIYE